MADIHDAMQIEDALAGWRRDLDVRVRAATEGPIPDSPEARRWFAVARSRIVELERALEAALHRDTSGAGAWPRVAARWPAGGEPG